MTMQTLSWAWDLRGVTPTAKLLALYIANNAGGEFHAAIVNVGHAREFVGVEMPALRQAFEELLGRGLSVVEALDDEDSLDCRIPLPRERRQPHAPDQSRASRPGELYVVTAGGRTKIGISTDIHGRIGWLQSGNPDRIQVVLRLGGSIGDARAVEREAHRRLTDRRIAGEWFDVTGPEAVQVVFAVVTALGLALETREGPP